MATPIQQLRVYSFNKCTKNTSRLTIGPVHTYPDSFESETFSFWMKKNFSRPQVAY